MRRLQPVFTSRRECVSKISRPLMEEAESIALFIKLDFQDRFIAVADAQKHSSDKAQRQVRPDEEPVLGWRPAVGQSIPNTRWVLKEKLGVRELRDSQPIPDRFVWSLGSSHMPFRQVARLFRRDR